MGLDEFTRRWKKQYGDLGMGELREMRQRRDKNRRLKSVVADLNGGTTDVAELFLSELGSQLTSTIA